MRGQIVILMVTALIENKGRYLVLKRSLSSLTNKGRWQFPEDKVRIGEDILRALKREVREETSLTLRNVKLVGIHSSYFKQSHGVFRLFRTVFRCKAKGDVKLSSEHSQYMWVDRKQIKKMNFLGGFDLDDMIPAKK
jgi:8-oxo-dGTP diphosphatase